MIRFFKAIFQAVYLCFPIARGVRYFRHKENKFLYVLISEKHIKKGEENKVSMIIEKSVRCNVFRFNFIACYYDTQIITIADDNLIDDERRGIEDVEIILESPTKN
jgi:peroxiredoxin family protein